MVFWDNAVFILYWKSEESELFSQWRKRTVVAATGRMQSPARNKWEKSSHTFPCTFWFQCNFKLPIILWGKKNLPASINLYRENPLRQCRVTLLSWSWVQSHWQLWLLISSKFFHLILNKLYKRRYLIQRNW